MHGLVPVDEIDKAATCSVRAATCSRRSYPSSGLYVRTATDSESIVINNFAGVITAFKVVTSPEALTLWRWPLEFPPKTDAA